ncbi:MAG: Crp/Fnr family transcriptional regulator [Elusimicrobiota bacterium]
MNYSSAIVALKKITLFSGLSYPDLKRLAKLARVHHIPKGSLIFRKKMAGNHLFVVLRGRIKIFSELDQSTKKKTFAYLEQGDFFGEMSLLDKKGRSLSAHSLGETELMTISRNEFQRLLAAEPSFALKVLKTTIERLRQANEEIESLTFRSLYGRICRKILDIAGKRSRFKNGRFASITHNELAELAGTAREMVTKVLSSLRRLGVIAYEDHHIKIVTESKLKELAQIEP